jgi:hypothetical protein
VLFTPRLNEALEKVKASCYAHSVTDADHENILSLEKSFSMEAKFCQEAKKVVFRINIFPTFIICFLHSLEK